MSKIKKKLKVDENKLDEIIEESLGDDDIRQYLPNATILKYSDLNSNKEKLEKSQEYGSKYFIAGETYKYLSQSLKN